MPVLEQSSPIDKVESYYRDMIAQAEFGDRLPSVRKVMRQCSASRGVVERVLSRLHGEGLIEPRKRSGLFRAETPATDLNSIDLLFFGSPEALAGNGFITEFISLLTAELAKNSEYLRVRVMRNEPDPQAVIQSIASQPSSRVLVYFASVEDLHLFRPLEKAGIPYVHVLPNILKSLPSSLEIDDDTLVQQQLDHLLSLGHRRIAFLHAVRDGSFDRPLHMRLEAFYRISAEYKLPIEPEWVCYVGYDDVLIRRGVRKLMTGPNPPSALIIYDRHTKAVYAQLREMGLEPGRDVSVVGTDDMPWAEHVDPPLTTIRVSRSMALHQAMDMLQAVRTAKCSDVQHLETRLITRASTCEAKK
jgi:DNA-binding LacI/PurR family transcriptional regulator